MLCSSFNSSYKKTKEREHNFTELAKNCNITFAVESNSSFAQVHLEFPTIVDFYNVSNQILGSYNVTGPIDFYIWLPSIHPAGRVKITSSMPGCSPGEQVYCQDVAKNATFAPMFSLSSPCCGATYTIIFTTGRTCPQ